MPITMNERLDMLQQVSRAWLDLTRTLSKLTDAQLLQPDTIGHWSGKDVLAHLANWEQIAAETIEEAEAGNPDAWPEDAYHSVVDEMNDSMLEPWRDRSLADVRQYLDDAHFTLMNLAETSPHVRPDLVVYLTATHYAEHADDFRLLATLPR
ncbi:MAG TPA: ClbS/DfsB family four-helix bundle protein [Thermomicrobiales bacterium]|nr:ClbS/DfsB family four-helix bundle protein [Thermomicrobiales bacterium]